MALHLEAFATEFSRLWRSWDWLSRPLTHFIFALECLAPLLALVPNYWCRLIGLFALVALEVGIWLSLEVGLFPLIALISLVPLFPGRLIDFGLRMRRGRMRESDLVLFYDRDCRFCAFACRLLIAVCGIQGARMQEAQSDSTASGILDESFAWSVTRVRRPEQGGAEDDLDPDFRQGWAAVRLLVRNSPRSWLLRVLPGDVLGDRLYAWIGRNRGAIGRLGGACFGRDKPSVWQGPIGQSVASFALVVVLAWNVVTYPAVRHWVDLRPYVAPVISLLNLQQYWDMFAPHPYAFDYWHVMPALARDGSRVDLLSSAPIVLEPPVDGPDHYGGYRWRKTILRSLQRGQIDRVFRYHCLTGHWAALDLWEFARPNLGVAATAEQAYWTVLRGRWQCDAVDMSVVDGFRSDIDSMMREYARR